MCGPSSDLKALNKTVKGALDSAKTVADKVFGAASSVFDNISGSLQRIVTGGPSQAGMSQGELNAKNAAAIQNGATLARNAGGAAATSAAAIGGGNAVTPAGGTQQAVLQAKIAAGEMTAEELNKVQTENYERGNQNYWSAVKEEQQLPGVFNPAISAEGAVDKAAGTALSVQKEMDTQANWWQPMVTAAIGGASSALTGGLTSGLGAASKFAAPVLGALKTPSYMPGGGGDTAAPDMTGQYASAAFPTGI